MTSRRPSKTGTGAAGPDADEFRPALDTALRLLGNRPRSEQEIRRRLGRQAALPAATIDEVVTRLRQWRLVDDSAFARYWVEQRQTFRPRGARLIAAELRQRGVSSELAASAAEQVGLDAERDAYRAAHKKASQLARLGEKLEEHTFRARLGQFLARRGFDWEAIVPVVDRLWGEMLGPKAAA